MLKVSIKQNNMVVSLLLPVMFVLFLHLTIFLSIDRIEAAAMRSYRNFYDVIKAESKDFTLFQYKLFFTSPYFYLDKPSILINFKRNTRFDPPKIKEYLIKNWEEFLKKKDSFSKPHYMIVEKRSLADIKKIKFEVVGSKKRFLLLRLE
jgi:hypothetical protein